MKCPECNLDLDTPNGLSPCTCPSCAGIWIGGRALRAMFAGSDDQNEVEQTLDSILELDFKGSRRRCPNCVVRHLKAVNIGRTEIDFCASCKGLFFDPGELERVFPGIQGQDSRSQQTGERGFWVALLRFVNRR
jgi:Zn-finger nucleic acid-binding protein